MIVPQDSEGFADGTEVDVFLYDSLVAGNGSGSVNGTNYNS